MAYDFHIGRDVDEASKQKPKLQIEDGLAENLFAESNEIFGKNEHLARLKKRLEIFYGADADIKFLVEELDALISGLEEWRSSGVNSHIHSFSNKLINVAEEAKSENKCLFGFSD